MSGRTRTILIVVGALALAIASPFILPTKTPEVSVRPEEINLFGLPVTNSLLMMLVVDLVLIVVAVAATSNMQLIPRGMQNLMEAAIEALQGLFNNINAQYAPRVFPFVATLFLYILFSNYLGLIPGPTGSIGQCFEKHHEEAVAGLQLASTVTMQAEEAAGPNFGCPEGYVLHPLLRSPSADLNNTLALAISAFLFIEYWGFRSLGLGYLGKFFNFREGFIGFFVGIFELISELARILSFSFRLFGNIFAGEVVLSVMAFLVPFVLPLPFYGLEVFVGFIQAFIFSVLVMAFISQAVTGHGHEEHHPIEQHAGHELPERAH